MKPNICLVYNKKNQQTGKRSLAAPLHHSILSPPGRWVETCRPPLGNTLPLGTLAAWQAITDTDSSEAIHPVALASPRADGPQSPSPLPPARYNRHSEAPEAQVRSPPPRSATLPRPGALP